MRGAHRRGERQRQREGIIPAYAGSTATTSASSSMIRDHPRVCGEHKTRTETEAMPPGSSPRMRGARRLRVLGGGCHGIIPAYAGSTGSSAGSAPWRWDHPRVCGEHIVKVDRLARLPGSSPRMRGAREALGAKASDVGIIPAYAGSTGATSATACATEDHPRVCGEHAGRGLEFANDQGSSPRMRGAPARFKNLDGRKGIIPAYAGSTLKYLVRYGQTSSFSFTSQGSKPPDIIVERPSNHPFLSAEFPCAVILARFAPTFLRRPCECGFFCSARPPN